MEVADVMMIEEKEVIFFTQGGEYMASHLAERGGAAAGPEAASSSGVPSVVGAYKVHTVLHSACPVSSVACHTPRRPCLILPILLTFLSDTS